MAGTSVDFERAKRRGRFEAWLLDATSKRMESQFGQQKASMLSELEGTIVELGPGTGANLAYYRPGVHVIGIEPNPAMHPRLKAKASLHSVDLEIRAIRGERLDIEDESADAVVATLVLCGVDDPPQVVSEVKRVLKPGGKYVFIEHVAAPHGSITRRVQGVLNRPHRWFMNGCEVHRETGRLLSEARFSDLEMEEVDMGLTGSYVRNFIVGVATR